MTQMRKTDYYVSSPIKERPWLNSPETEEDSVGLDLKIANWGSKGQDLSNMQMRSLVTWCRPFEILHIQSSIRTIRCFINATRC